MEGRETRIVFAWVERRVVDRWGISSGLKSQQGQQVNGERTVDFADVSVRDIMCSIC
jgi:hypothetical protein